jgi:hypothetical protein
LHPEIGQQSFQHSLFLRHQITIGLFLQHPENVDPVLTQLDVNLALVRYRMLHHSQCGSRIRSD